MKLDLIHADDHILIVNKPAGLLTIPDRISPEKDNLLGILQQKYGKVMVVHRLDRETSGILCFARDEAAHRHLSIQFEKHTVDKFYHALLDGVLHIEEGEVNKPIGEHPTIPGKMAITSGGKPSLTFFRALERFNRFTLAEILIKTGRTHQIRVHMQNVGYPLTIDSVYGRREAILLSEVKGRGYKMGKFTEEERPIMSRSSLHASRLRIDHPVTGERMEFKTELPKDFSALLSQLRKWKG